MYHMSETQRRVGLRELRHDARGVVERAATEGPIEITDRGAVIAVLTSACGTDRRRSAPKIDRALQLLERSPATDTGALEELLADKRADIESAER